MDIVVAAKTGIGHDESQNVGVTFTQHFCPLVDGITQLSGCGFDQFNFFTADIATAVQDVGNGALRYTGQIGNIL